MPKRKKVSADDLDGENVVPITIQNFFWRQTSPFIRPKLGKLCEASCVTFERVLVQNILHGLSPSLCESIQNVSRWKLIQAAFPHVMHCCAAALQARRNNDPDAKFDSNEIKLLYTLHWIVLDAASECEDLEVEKLGGPSLYTYLHSLDTIQLFVYLFAPLINTIKQPDFESLKLEPGLRLWQPLWDFAQPDVPCFSTPVKAKRVLLKAQRHMMKVNFNTANIYIGKGTSNENVYLGFDDDDDEGDPSVQNSPRAPLARMSDICAWSASETATSVEIICEICNETLQHRNGEVSCECGTRRASYISNQSMPDPRLSMPIDQDYITKSLEDAMNSIVRCSPNQDVLSASYFDIAVLRCLFCPQWSEDGVYWALRYVHQRLLEVCDENNRVEFRRERSRSLPTPDIEKDVEFVAPPTPPTPTRLDAHSRYQEPKFLKETTTHEPKKKKVPTATLR